VIWTLLQTTAIQYTLKRQPEDPTSFVQQPAVKKEDISLDAFSASSEEGTFYFIVVDHDDGPSNTTEEDRETLSNKASLISVE
jgi:hypothetical protein